MNPTSSPISSPKTKTNVLPSLFGSLLFFSRDSVHLLVSSPGPQLSSLEPKSGTLLLKNFYWKYLDLTYIHLLCLNCLRLHSNTTWMLKKHHMFEHNGLSFPCSHFKLNNKYYKKPKNMEIIESAYLLISDISTWNELRSRREPVIVLIISLSNVYLVSHTQLQEWFVYRHLEKCFFTTIVDTMKLLLLKKHILIHDERFELLLKQLPGATQPCARSRWIL